MEYRIVAYAGGYHVTRYNPKTMATDTIGEFDSIEAAQEFKAYLEGVADVKGGQ